MARTRRIDGDQRVLTERAYAKVNLTLEVLRKRSDGYHDLVSIVQTVDLFDTLTFNPADDLTLDCDDDELVSEGNLVLRAAEVLRNSAGIETGAKITLEKRIPVSAGLGGGSADAAATLRALNKLWELGLTSGELVEIAASVGADVPFLVEGGTALMQGKGEELERLPAPHFDRIVLVAPKAKLAVETQNDLSKTGVMFEALGQTLHTTGSLSRKLAARMNGGGDCHPAFMFNVFQQMAPGMYSDWKSVYGAFAALGAADITLTGSGPAMFALAPSKEVGTAWAMLMKSRSNSDAFSVGIAPRVSV